MIVAGVVSVTVTLALPLTSVVVVPADDVPLVLSGVDDAVPASGVAPDFSSTTIGALGTPGVNAWRSPDTIVMVVAAEHAGNRGGKGRSGSTDIRQHRHGAWGQAQGQLRVWPGQSHW